MQGPWYPWLLCLSFRGTVHQEAPVIIQLLVEDGGGQLRIEMTSLSVKEPKYQNRETLEPEVQLKELEGRKEESQERMASPPPSP